MVGASDAGCIGSPVCSEAMPTVSASDGTAAGGLSGDGARFEQTLVGLDAVPEEGRIAVLGFYGDRLKVGYGSLGGWDPFGNSRPIASTLSFDERTGVRDDAALREFAASYAAMNGERW